jgi:hypothetical protein
MIEDSLVRQNLMTIEGYSPYCGSDLCILHFPRTTWRKDKDQFTCGCGWVSQFPKDFIGRYKNKWNK